MSTEQTEIIGYVSSTESFGAVDGPGVRFIVFLQGCQMRCRYCHNPETWKLTGGKPYTPQALYEQAKRYKPYWKNGGGITVSGGEALLQIDFVTEFFRIAKADGVHTTLDTSGNPFTRQEPFFGKFQKLMEVTDLYLLDIKQINEEKHRALTGWTNANILDLAGYLSENGKHMWIRHVLVPGITTDEADLKELAAFLKTLKTVDRVEVLPYHSLGVPKWKEQGIPYTLEDTLPPTAVQLKTARDILGC